MHLKPEIGEPPMAGNPQAQWMINLGQALVEKQNRDPNPCKLCHKNPAEYSGYCGDCYEKLQKNEKTKKVTKRRFWLFSFFDQFSR